MMYSKTQRARLLRKIKKNMALRSMKLKKLRRLKRKLRERKVSRSYREILKRNSIRCKRR
jgi:hypothetical protein